LDWPGLARLRTLSLAGNPLGDVAAQMLAGTPALAGLEALNLNRASVTVPGCVLLLQSPHLRSLRRLDVGREWGYTGSGQEALPLLTSPWLGQLEEFRLPRLEAPDVFLQRLATCPEASGLRALDLHGSRITPDTARALVESPHLNGLKYLGVAA